jgi:drug/metabolite transporter (DMT)-like permease
MTKAALPARRLAALLSLTAAMVLTGANVVLGKVIVAEVPVYTLHAVSLPGGDRRVVAAGQTGSGPKLRQMTRGQVRDLIGMALLGMIGFTALMLEGLQRTSAAGAGIITARLPAVAALLGVVVLRERLSLSQAGAVALAMAGLVLVVATGSERGTATLLGNLLVMGAVVCEASFVILGKRLALPYQPLRLALGANVVGLACAAPLALRDAVRSCRGAALDLAHGHLVRVVGQFFCLWLWYRGLPHVEAWLAGLSTAAIPVTALAGSTLVLAESIEALKLLVAPCGRHCARGGVAAEQALLTSRQSQACRRLRFSQCSPAKAPRRARPHGSCWPPEQGFARRLH